ncbi:Protein kinase domain [Trypanosoma melophagium]|uniref:Protein kinase domain n=1 Tax=Trypanosoma melophagium TaxID=715481 RepID=UPI00351A0ABB|nr:Protein kinase domain [Trypanosoma melophagium]
MATAGAEAYGSPLRNPTCRLAVNTPMHSPLSSWYIDSAEAHRGVMSPMSPLQCRSSAIYGRRSSPIVAARGLRASCDRPSSNPNPNGSCGGGGAMSPRYAIVAQRRYQLTPTDYFSASAQGGSQRAGPQIGRTLSSTLGRSNGLGSPLRHSATPSAQSPLLDVQLASRPFSARQTPFRFLQQEQEQEQEQQQQQQQPQLYVQQYSYRVQQVAGQKIKGNRKDDDSLVTSSNDLSNTDDGTSYNLRVSQQECANVRTTKITHKPIRELTRVENSPARMKVTSEPFPKQYVHRVMTPVVRRQQTPEYYHPVRNDSSSLDNSGFNNTDRIDLNVTLNREFPIHESLCVDPRRRMPNMGTVSNMYSSIHSIAPHRDTKKEEAVEAAPQSIAAAETATAGVTPVQSSDCSRTSTDTSNIVSNLVTKTPLYIGPRLSFVSSRSIMQQFVQRWRNHYEENKSAYYEGGYMSVTPGKKLNSRYVVVQKLGWGEFSTVWLAYDTLHTTLGKPHQAFVALKIAKCDNTVSKSTQYEINLLRYLRNQAETGTPLTDLVDCFEVKGEYGSHVCMVMPLHGSNLLSIIDQMKAKKCIRSASEIRLIKEIVASMLVGLKELDRLDIIHTDIKPENVLCSSPDPRVLHVIETFCRRNKERSTMVPYEKIHEAMSQGDPNHLVLLADFGLSAALKPSSAISSSTLQGTKEEVLLKSLVGSKKEFPVEKPGTVSNLRGTMIQTREYRAPEIIIGLDFNTRTDIWSVGCMVYELITGDFLMDPKRRTRNERMMDIEHLAMMMQLLGPVPDEIIKLRTKRDPHRPPPRYIHRYFDENGRFIYADKYRLYPRRHLERELELYLPPAEARDAAGFIMRCLETYDPSKRPSARCLLGHVWLSEVTCQ